MVKVEMYKAFDGKVFENREDCVAYEEILEQGRYEKLKELKEKIDEYCDICNECCSNCILEENCGNMYRKIVEEIKKFEEG